MTKKLDKGKKIFWLKIKNDKEFDSTDFTHKKERKKQITMNRTHRLGDKSRKAMTFEIWGVILLLYYHQQFQWTFFTVNLKMNIFLFVSILRQYLLHHCLDLDYIFQIIYFFFCTHYLHLLLSPPYQHHHHHHHHASQSLFSKRSLHRI